MEGEPTPAEVVTKALVAEEEASLLYRMLADMASEGEARNRLLRLAKDEEGHARVLRELAAVLADDLPPPTLPSAAEGSPTIFDFASRSPREVLEFALRNEVTSERVYRDQSERATDPEAAETWRMLADAERGHAEVIRLQLRLLG